MEKDMKGITSIKFGENDKYIILELKSRTFPNAKIDWDRDAINATIKVNSGNFQGIFDTIIWSHELNSLSILLLELEKRIKDSPQAVFQLREATVKITFYADLLGHINLYIEVCDDPAADTELKFTINSDQSFLPIWFEEICTVLKRFPPQIKNWKLK